MLARNRLFANTLSKYWCLRILNIIIGAFFLASSVQCSTAKREPTINAVKLIYKLPVAGLQKPDDTSMVLEYVADSLYLFYSEDTVVYKLPVINTIQYGNSPVEKRITYSYFSYKKGADSGLFFDSLESATGKKMEVNSILKEKAFGNLKIAMTEEYHLIETVNLPDQDVLIEKYRNQARGLMNPDTTILYYSNALKGIDFSLSDSLDNVKGRKLSKVRLVFNSQFYEGYPVKFPRRELSLEMQKLAVSRAEEHEVSRFFEIQ